MTAQDKEIQELRREVKWLREENGKLMAQAAEDMSQLAYYRRQIDFLMEAAEK